MTAIKENDAVRIRHSVQAEIIGDESHKAFFPVGTPAAVVHVFKSEGKPVAYELEFVVKDGKSYALATVEADAVMIEWRAPTG